MCPKPKTLRGASFVFELLRRGCVFGGRHVDRRGVLSSTA